MKKLVLISLVLITASCTTSGNKRKYDAVQNKQPSLHEKIYYLQHRLLPRWTHGPDNSFYNELMSGNLYRLKQVATDFVSREYANKITARQYPETDGVIITFPEPDQPNECYFIYIARTGNGFRFVTYEKAEDLLGKGHAGAVGEWTKEGKHLNMGFRKYRDAASFVKEIQAR